MEDSMPEKEKTIERSAIYIGRLGDLGLGNPDGIPSRLKDASPEELRAFGEELLDELTPPTDTEHWACIDGRHVLQNADGSEAEIRLRHVGGTASTLGIALNSGAKIEGLDPTQPLGDNIEVVDEFLEKTIGVKPSAHQGGCGGAKGEVDDNEAIASTPEPTKAAEALLGIPEVHEHTGVTFDEVDAQAVATNAVATAQYLKESGWEGQKYVDGVVNREPAGVEDLEVDHDHDFHGHQEDALVIVLGEETLPRDDIFVLNMETVIAEARALAQGDETVYRRAIIAGVAKHMNVGKRLPSPDTPVYVLVA